jgi:hypothetical protein
MNILLWVLQILLALHTAFGAVWKFNHSAEQTMASLRAIPRRAWLGMSAAEFLAAAGLVVAGASSSLGLLAPVAASAVVAEMIVFCGLHVRSGARDPGPMIYWLAVAALASFVAAGRLFLEPI